MTETYVNQTSELVHVFVGDEEIITTPTHPFYSPVKGWTDAVQLRAGDILVHVNGEYVVVEKVRLVTDVFPYSTTGMLITATITSAIHPPEAIAAHKAFTTAATAKAVAAITLCDH